MGEYRTIGRHTLVYGAGMIIGKLASFIMLPVYTHHLTPADYGVLELLGTTIDVIAMIAGIGLASGVFKYHAQFDDPKEKNEVVSTVAIGTIALSLVTALIGVIASPWLTRLIFGSGVDPLYFRIFFLIYFLQAIGGIPFMLIRAQQRSMLFVTLNVVKLVAVLSLTIYFVVVLQMGILGVLLSTCIASGALAIFLCAYTFRHVGFGFSWPKFRQLSEFGAPLVVWSLGSFVLTFSDRYFLNYYADAAAVGIYSLAYKFSFLLSAFAVAPFQQVWDPQRFVIAKQPNAAEVYRRMFLYLNVGMIGGAIIILLFVGDVLRVMVPSTYWSAGQVIPLLLVTTILQQWAAYCNFSLYLKEATGLLGWSAIAGVVVALGLNFLLIPSYGIMGAAWATVGAYAVRFLIIYVAAQAQYRIEYPWLRVGGLMAAFGVAMVARGAVEETGTAASVGMSILLLFALSGVVYGWLLTREERAAIRGLVGGVFTLRLRGAT